MAKVDIKYPFINKRHLLKSIGQGVQGLKTIAAKLAAEASDSMMYIVPANRVQTIQLSTSS